MKNLFKFTLLAAFFLVNSVSCDLFEDDEDTGTVSDYSNQLADLSTVNQSFVEATHDFVSANLSNLSVSEVSALMDNFIKTGEDFVANLEAIEKFQKNSSGGYAEKSASAVCTVYDVVPTLDNGVGVGLVKSVGDIIGEAKGDINNLNKMLENGEIDENQYKDAVDELRQKKLLKAGGLTIGAITGTGAAVVTGAVVGVATLPAIATVAVVGGVVGGTVTWFANWYSGANKSAIADESKMYLISGKTTNGGIIPLNHLKSGMNLTLVPEGMAPVTITNFELPESGTNRTIEFEPKDLNNASKEEGYEVCFIDEAMPANSCSDVMFVNAYPSPANPAPGQDVTVYASVTPPISGCSISFTIVGTDGYSDSETALTNSQGQASFGIPGAESETVDVVTITTSNGKSYTVSYVF
ncbi:hypothetical protein SAMN05444280_13631 [Tangfeifania diversioriginum]|uniref:Big-1 domain-containing protein n=1 Tax=Tangfeifania diversioriginum TaxID=1168035 RepID=A0A1M6MVT9_9BACT|nr:hypothetical protein [Tangfeifania diversioriginum]SHJ87520.1 hypothetical protein SAMN05444280_13631 [Tangfeifania diversioriginum]